MKVAHRRLLAAKAPELELLSLQYIEDVTAKVNAAVKSGMSSAEMSAAIAGRR